VIATISCNTAKTTGNRVIEKAKPEYLDGDWSLQMLFASDNNWTKAPFLNINVKDKTFSGNAGCNIIRGKFTINESYIEFDKNIISTKMACPGNYENTFLSALLKVNKYSILKEDLELSQGEIVLMKFKRSQVRLP
jgi:heat shock protein HslJ